jgi:hypothetical protein
MLMITSVVEGWEMEGWEAGAGKRLDLGMICEWQGGGVTAPPTMCIQLGSSALTNLLLNLFAVEYNGNTSYCQMFSTASLFCAFSY